MKSVGNLEKLMLVSSKRNPGDISPPLRPMIAAASKYFVKKKIAAAVTWYLNK
jgi:hypothetical protein